ncbi:MAG: hypothetical protein ACHQ4H_15695 [Ktedonobacterales bacterium]
MRAEIERADGARASGARADGVAHARQWVARHWAPLAAALLVALGAALRLALSAAGWPATNSDEATIGLMARHIAYGGAHPVFFYGNDYMGAFEAYLAAPLFRLFGPSVMTLRLATVLLFAGFAVCTYALAAALYDRWLALIAVFVLALGSREIIFREVFAAGGYPETLFFGALLFLLAFGCARSCAVQPTERRGWRLAGYAAWGLVAGLALWSDPVVLTYVAASAALLAVGCRRELWPRGGVAALAGLALGGLPVILYNLSAPAGHSTAAAIWQIATAGAPGNRFARLAASLSGTVIVSLPRITGAPLLCTPHGGGQWPPAGGLLPANAACVAVGLSWSAGALALWALAITGSFALYRRARRSDATAARQDQPHAVAMARDETRALARLLLLAGAGATFVLYAFSGSAGSNPWSNARYLSGLLVATPAVLAPLAERSGGWRRAWGEPRWRRQWVVRGASVVALAGIAASLAWSTLDVARTTAPAQAAAQQRANFVSYLLAHGLTRIYTDYWTCNRLAFESGERVVCAVLGDDLRPGENRYSPYAALVAASSTPAAYVFLADSPQAAALAKHSAPLRARGYIAAAVDGYMVYRVPA